MTLKDKLSLAGFTDDQIDAILDAFHDSNKGYVDDPFKLGGKDYQSVREMAREIEAKTGKAHNNLLVFNAGLKQTSDILGNMGKSIASFNDPWAKADHAASQYTKTIGMAAKGMDALRKNTINNVVKGHLGFDFNVSTDELIKAQEDYVKATGRNLRIDNAAQSNLAAIKSIYGDVGTEFSADFEKFGLGIEATGKHMGKMYSDASKSGISLAKYAENVKKGLAMAQNYTFTGGLKSMEAMAKRATSIRMDMEQVQRMADSVDTVEKAIGTAAKIQVLGGPFAAAADPMAMMREGLMDPEALQKRMASITSSFGKFNKETGEVEISAYNRQRLKAYADATGQDFNNLIQQTQQQAKNGEVEAQIRASSNASLHGLDEDMRNLVKNSATFKDGRAGVSINGEWKSIDDLQGNDYEELVKETQSESEDIKDIAKSVRSLVDIREGAKKQKDAMQAKFSEDLFIGKFEKLSHNLARCNFLLGILIANKLAGVGADIFGDIRGIFQTFGHGGGRGASSNHAILQDIAGGEGGKKAFGRIFGKNSAKKVGEEAAEAAAKKAAEGTARKEALKASAKSVAKKAGAKALSIGKVIGPGGIAGLVGAVGNIATDMLVANGKIEKGSKGHAAAKGVSSALEGVGLGMLAGMAGTGIGAPLAIALGAIMGGRAIAKVRRGKELDERLSAKGIERKGEYSPEKLKQINKGLENGKMSNKLKKKLIREGDIAIVNEIEGKKNAIEAKRVQKREERKAKIKERRDFNSATFNIGVAKFNGGGLGRILGKPEDGGRREKVKKGKNYAEESTETATNKRGNKDFNINITGSLKLEGKNGQNVDIIDELRKNPQMLTALADLIAKEIDKNNKGAYVTK